MSDYYRLLTPNNARVKREEQLRLFQQTPAEFVKRYRVSHERLMSWAALGLLSFEPKLDLALDLTQEAELSFLLSLTRLGFSDEQLTSFLSKLTKPYTYDVSTLLYDLERRRFLMRQPALNLDVYSCIQRAKESADVRALREIAQEALKALASVAEQALERASETGEREPTP